MTRTDQINKLYSKNIEKNLEKAQNNCKMLQARFDCACSWTVVVSASYAHAPNTGLSMCPYGDYQEIFNVAQVSFLDKRRMIPKLKKACALNKKTMGGTK